MIAIGYGSGGGYRARECGDDVRRWASEEG